MKTSRQLTLQPRRDAWLEVNLQALEANALALSRFLPRDVSVMAVLKADAYGHGATMVIPVLEACGIQSIGVASVDEAVQLREAGVLMPILVLGGVPDWAVPVAVQHHLQLTVFTERHLDNLLACYRMTGVPVEVHIKVDTGMHRIGVPWEQAASFYRQCVGMGPAVSVQGLFTHLASAEATDPSALQIERWHQVLGQLPKPLPPWRHVTNSAGTLNHLGRVPETNLVRVGLALFGYGGGAALPLTPLMSLKARIVHLQDLPVGEGVSYGQRWTTQRPTRLATIPLGYADGVPRGLSGQLVVGLHGQKCSQVGSITMDQMMIDVTDVPDAQVGDTVSLLSPALGLTLTAWAEALGTIEYELMCGLRVRLPRIYTR